MKKLALLFALLLAVGVRADVETTAVPVAVGGGGSFSGGAITTSILGPAADNCATPPYSFTGDTNTGICTRTADTVSFWTAGAEAGTISGAAFVHGSAAANTRFLLVNSNGVSVRQGMRFQWGASSGDAGGAADTIIGREATGVVQMGDDVNGVAVAQVIKAHDGVTGTDIAGANMTVACGRGTGAGTACDSILQTGTALGTGTAAQTLVTRYQAEGGLRALTDATATTVITVTTGNDLSCGGTLFFTVEAADAANQQATSGSVNFAAADNAAGAGGEACAAAVTGTNAAAATSGTLTVTADATTGTDLCNIRLTATGSLTETVGPRVRYSVVFNPTSSSCAFTPQ
jgi:hypothetical protein